MPGKEYDVKLKHHEAGKSRERAEPEDFPFMP
jgi:hypothetical protein